MAKTALTKSRRGKAKRPERATTASKRNAMGSNGGRLQPAFFERKSIEQLAAEQGVKPTRLEDILGKGVGLWESDQEFEQFVEDIYARRRQDRELAEQRAADRSIRRKRGDSLVGTLRRQYGENFSEDSRSDMRLDKAPGKGTRTVAERPRAKAAP